MAQNLNAVATSMPMIEPLTKSAISSVDQGNRGLLEADEVSRDPQRQRGSGRTDAPLTKKKSAASW